MKKIFIVLSVFTTYANIYSQTAKVSYSEEIPETASTTGQDLYNPMFANSAVCYIAHGLTVFKQTKELFLIDKKTLAINKKILLPKIEGYEVADELVKGYRTALKNNEIIFYKRKVNKKTELSGLKVDESFNVPAAPEYMLGGKDISTLTYGISEAKNICVFNCSSVIQKKNYFFFWVFDNNLKLLKSDSLLFDAEADNVSVIPYNNGYILSKGNTANYELKITNLKNSKTITATLKSGANKFNILTAKTLSTGKIIICGNYNSPEKKKFKNGVFRLVINPENGTVEEQVLFENIPAGKAEIDEIPKHGEYACIDESGTCYILLNQENGIGYKNKHELFGIANNAKWKRQLPMPAYTNSNYTFPMFIYKDGLYLSYTDYEADKPALDYFDYNKYVYGNPYPSETVTNRQTYRGHTTLLSVSPDGNIKPQHLVGVSGITDYMGNGVLMGIYQGLNGQVTSKCKIVKISLD